MKDSIRVERVDHVRAQQFLDCNTYAGQRPIRSGKIEYLIERLKRGLFLHGRFALVKMHDGSIVLINGQHQAAMIVRSRVVVEASVQTFELEKGEGADTVAQLFAQFDTEGGRSVTDVIRYYLQAFNMTDVSPTAASRIASALTELEFPEVLGCGYGKGVSKDDRAALLGKHEKETRFCFSICGTHSNRARHMERVPVVTAIIQTYRISPSDAEIFWTFVRDGERSERGDPSYILREHLKSARSANRAEALEIQAKCIYAWNAYCRGEKLRVLKTIKDAPVPKPIKPKMLRRKSAQVAAVGVAS